MDMLFDFGFSSSSGKDAYSSDAKIALQNLEEFPKFDTLRKLLRELLKALGEFKLNKLAAFELRKQISKVTLILGQTDYGLVYHSKYIGKDVEESQLIPLEENFYLMLRFIRRRLTHPASVGTVMIGSFPQEKWHKFDETMVREVNTLLTDFNYLSISLLAPTRKHKFMCDLRSRIQCLTEAGGPWKQVAHKAGHGEATMDLLEDEVDMLHNYIDQTEESFQRLVYNSPINCIRQHTARDFWYKSFGTEQKVHIDVFMSSLRQYLESSLGMSSYTMGGRHSFDADGVADRIESALGKTTKKGILDCQQFAKLVRWVDPDSKAVFEEVANIAEAGAQRIMPPLLERIPFKRDYDQMEEISTLLDSPGWVNVHGRKGSGKSYSLLQACHGLPLDRDVLWIDLLKTTNEMEITSRFISQLFLSTAVYEVGFEKAVQNMMASCQPGSVVVFDNVDNANFNPAGIAFETWLYEIIDELLKPSDVSITFVIVTEKPMSVANHLTKRVEVTALDSGLAIELAEAIFPARPNLLVEASGSLAGRMVRLANLCSLNTLRYVCQIKNLAATAEVDINSASDIVLTGVATDLSPEESLCASCLLKGLAPFDEALAWSFCKEAFDHDITRWSFAWQGLVESHWLAYIPDLGYIVEPKAVVQHVDIKKMGHTLTTYPVHSAQGQYDVYAEHWARETKRVNDLCYENPSAIEYFDFNRAHFKSIFGNFFSVANVVSTTMQHSFLATLAEILAGNIGKILELRFAGNAGVKLAKGVYEQVKKCVGVNSITETTVLAAATEYATELLRSKEASAVRNAVNMLASLLQKCNDDLSEERFRAEVVMGDLHHFHGHTNKAEGRYTGALNLLEASGKVTDDHRGFVDVNKRLASVKMNRHGGCCFFR